VKDRCLSKVYGVVTVFGGTGFLGRRIVERLAAAGARVRVAVRHTKEAEALQGGGIEVAYADVRDGTSVADALRERSACTSRARGRDLPGGACRGGSFGRARREALVSGG